jgi:MarR family transcriptional regulator for hemolysin
MLEYDFEASVGYWICMTSHALRRALDAELAREKITLRQWEVLASIALNGDLSQSELAERLGIEAPTLAGILARMERDGWLERASCPEDRRKKRIRVTEQAEAVWNRMAECCRRVRQQAVQGISDEDLAQLRDTCERIRSNLGTLDPLLQTACSAD